MGPKNHTKKRNAYATIPVGSGLSRSAAQYIEFRYTSISGNDLQTDRQADRFISITGARSQTVAGLIKQCENRVQQMGLRGSDAGMTKRELQVAPGLRDVVGQR